jgi:hypothetical protein
MTKYRCDTCETVHSCRTDAERCCAEVSEVEECPKCGKAHRYDEYPCCYVEEDEREGHADKTMWDKWDKENS